MNIYKKRTKNTPEENNFKKNHGRNNLHPYLILCGRISIEKPKKNFFHI